VANKEGTVAALSPCLDIVLSVLKQHQLDEEKERRSALFESVDG
jgi:hypothetical protein